MEKMIGVTALSGEVIFNFNKTDILFQRKRKKNKIEKSWLFREICTVQGRNNFFTISGNFQLPSPDARTLVKLKINCVMTL